MQLAFILTMPNRGSWNGRWSGEDNFYCIIKAFRGKKGIEKAQSLALRKYFHYSWSDGWGASIEVKEVSSSEAQQMRKKSKGFCGYDWMVNTILLYGKPMADHEVDEFLKSQREQEHAAL